MEMFLDNTGHWILERSSDAYWATRRLLLRVGMASVGGPTLGEQFHTLARQFRDDVVVYGPLGRWASDWQYRSKRERSILAACAAGVIVLAMMACSWAVLALLWSDQSTSDYELVQSIVSKALQHHGGVSADFDTETVTRPTHIRALGF